MTQQVRVKVKSTFYSDREGVDTSSFNHILGRVVDAAEIPNWPFPAYIVDIGYFQTVVHKDDCEEQLEFFADEFFLTDDIVDLASMIDAHTDSMWGVSDECCDNPQIVANTAMGKTFYVCSNCKKEVTKDGKRI